ncbi:MAG TPA: vitamin K epoxide reductase family protein [Gemmataceae bacterium]|nr:vitamin K epoxide reductase family protein [Gemmataceae bacterium]
MAQTSFPLGWTHNPSTWPRRFPALCLSLLGCAIATYLTLYQVDVVSTVWEPFFGNGSHMILKESALARHLPVPDASLGALAYLLDVILDCLGGETRWRTAPWIVLALGLVSGALGVTGILLAASQPLIFGHYCTLCLASAVCSILTALAVADEVRAAVRHLRDEPKA